MLIRRRAFLKYCVGSATALGLNLTVLGKLKKALAAGSDLPTVIWLNGANCTGCTVSLANLFDDSGGPANVADLLINYIDLAFHPNLMGAAGDSAVDQLNQAASGSYILAVDGGIPTAFNGHTCILWSENGHEVTAKEALQRLAPSAAAVLSIGTCASYGGIPAGSPNPTGIVSVSELINGQTINIPGCPTHPDWIVYTVANLLAGVVPPLDSKGRPTELFNRTVHSQCPRRELDEADTLGLGGRCLEEVGCRGESTYADCPSRKWNNKTNWCVGAGAVCIGCTEPAFPDRFSPFYTVGNNDAGSEDDHSDSNDDQGAGDTPPATIPLSVMVSEWVASSSQLKVEGKATPGDIVAVYNAASGQGLGAVSVETSGAWRFSMTNSMPVPTKVRVVCGAEQLEMTVKNAPAGGNTAVELDITKAVWRRRRSVLVVVVEGTPGTRVVLKNAGTHRKLGEGTISTDGILKFRKRNPSPIPRAVKVVADGLTRTRTVRNAPFEREYERDDNREYEREHDHEYDREYEHEEDDD